MLRGHQRGCLLLRNPSRLLRRLLLSLPALPALLGCGSCGRHCRLVDSGLSMRQSCPRRRCAAAVGLALCGGGHPVSLPMLQLLLLLRVAASWRRC